jgi:HD-GYP domain-containing protein (c-di-GMP phosphodiesterase class II)
MDFDLKRRSSLFWKIYGIGAIMVLTMISFFLKNGFLEKHHAEIMFGSLLLVVFLTTLLFFDALKIMRFQQQKIEGLMGIKLAFASLIDLKDSYTEGHSTHVRDLTRRFLEYLKLSATQIEEITIAAELHDIGKIGVPDSILKKPGKLTEEEFLEIKKHPGRGADAVKSLQGFETIAKIIRHHHEQHDGSGYPDGLKADKIPFGSKVLSIIDAYDAMIYSRAYRKAVTRKDTLSVLQEGTGKQFDPNLIADFLKFLQQENVQSQHDPVCGMDVDPKTSLFKLTHNKQTYTFCSQVCLSEFNNFPEKYSAESRDHNDPADNT